MSACVGAYKRHCCFFFRLLVSFCSSLSLMMMILEEEENVLEEILRADAKEMLTKAFTEKKNEKKWRECFFHVVEEVIRRCEPTLSDPQQLQNIENKRTTRSGEISPPAAGRQVCFWVRNNVWMFKGVVFLSINVFSPGRINIHKTEKFRWLF